MKSIISRIPYGVYNGLSVISAILTIVTFIYGVVHFSIEVRNVPGTPVIDVNKPLLFFCLILLIFLSVVLWKALKFLKVIQIHKTTTSENFYQLSHNTRNTYFDMLCTHKGAKNESGAHLTKITSEYLVRELDHLCDILTELTGKKIQGCIKLIMPQDSTLTTASTKIDRNTAEVITFCRSSNSEKTRSTIDGEQHRIKIVENTDFFQVLDFENRITNSCFYQSNLVDYDKKLRKINNGYGYLNSTKNWQNYYLSTIVAPIRVANKRLFFNVFDTEYSVIGFLCVDSKSTEAFRDREFDKTIYSNIVKSFADSFYIVLNMYSYYLFKLTE